MISIFTTLKFALLGPFFIKFQPILKIFLIFKPISIHFINF